MSDIAIKVEGLGKKYKIGKKKSGDLRESVNLILDRFRNKVAVPEESDFWALQDINFEIKQGEAVGVIGRNGAGKSTLLKILSRITEPTTGRIEINGRISSLLEVGTGFHPELTGRENIFLNGTILGMKRREVRQKFDEIVDFSGVEKFIDTPIKHYSSGMKVRLAFSVAAHLEPEILLIDEVLAVGDAEFQKKCLGKMEDVAGRGRTVVFVSHNMGAVQKLCSHGILLNNGSVFLDDEISHATLEYAKLGKSKSEPSELRNLNLRRGFGNIKLISIDLLSKSLTRLDVARTGEYIVFRCNFSCEVVLKDKFLRTDFAIDNEIDQRIGWFSSESIGTQFDDMLNHIDLHIPKLPFGPGSYYLTFYFTVNGIVEDYIHQAFYFEVDTGDYFGTGKVIPSSQTNFYIDFNIK